MHNAQKARSQGCHACPESPAHVQERRRLQLGVGHESQSPIQIASWPFVRRDPTFWGLEDWTRLAPTPRSAILICITISIFLFPISISQPIRIPICCVRISVWRHHQEVYIARPRQMRVWLVRRVCAKLVLIHNR